MQYKVYILILQFYIVAFSYVEAIIGFNIRPAYKNEYPSIVCIARYNPQNTWQHNILCTGTLISESHVLSAEHCFSEVQHQVEIVMGSHNVETGVRYYPTWWLSYNQWMTSQNLPIGDTYNDIILIKIFGLPTLINHCTLRYVSPPDLLNGLELTVVGCGMLENNTMPSILHMASLRVIDLETCMTRVSQLMGQRLLISDKFICTVGEPYTFLEIGDSGGPLLYDGQLVAVNLAICPPMPSPFHPNKVNIHISINYFRDFINHIIASV